MESRPPGQSGPPLDNKDPLRTLPSTLSIAQTSNRDPPHTSPPATVTDIMPGDPPPDDDGDEYASSEDSDFHPDDAAAVPESEDSDSGAESDKQKALSAKRARDDVAGENGNADLDNSGDEALIEKANKKHKKKRRRRKDGEDGEDGGEGGLVMTRSMRAAE